MYCPNCNAEIPDESASCGCCGHKLIEFQQYTAPAAPVYPGYSTYTSYSRPMNNMTKKEFLASDAGMSARGKAKLAVLACLIAVAVIVAGIFATLTMPIFNIPVMSVMLEASDVDADELVEELEELADEMEEDYDWIEDDLSKSEREDIEKWMDSANNLVDSCSILNMRTFVSDANMFIDEYSDELGDEFDMHDIREIAEAMAAVQQVMDAVIVFLVGFFFLPILFAVLGGTLKNTALTIVGIVFTAIAQIIFCGVLWVVLSLVVGVVQAVLCSKVNTAYRDYRMGKLPA